MCLSMAEIKGVMKFYTDHVRQKIDSVRRTIEKVEFYDEEDQSLTEKNEDSDFDQLPISDGSDLNEI